MPPGSGEGLPAAAATAPSVERLRWALHNLTAGSGLNSAVVVACGVPVEELQPPKAHEAEQRLIVKVTEGPVRPQRARRESG